MTRFIVTAFSRFVDACAVDTLAQIEESKDCAHSRRMREDGLAAS
jgi:hypothetical protein